MAMKLVCRDRHGGCVTYSAKRLPPTFGSENRRVYCVYAEDGSGDPLFELAVEDTGEKAFRVVMMSYFDPNYRGSGIPDALLPCIAADLKAEIVSSQAAQTGNQYRTPDATKVWKRLTSQGIATYDETVDVYSLVLN